jgi:hypothetical protein
MTEPCTFAVNLLDESFNPRDSANYGLAIMLSETTFSFCTLDFRRNKFLGLHSCIREDLKPMDGQAGPVPSMKEFLAGVFAAVPWLRNQFKLVKIAFDGKKSTLVPASLFDSNSGEQYIKFNFPPAPDELILFDHLIPPDAFLVFTMPEQVMAAKKEFFHTGKVVHSSSLLIESVWINYKNRINTPNVFLNVHENLFDIMIFDGRKMQYFNTFTFQNPEDVAYYLIFVLEQLNFNPEEIPLVLLGNVELKDGVSELLHRYIRHIDTGRRNESCRYSYMMNQLPSQSFFPLFNFFLCGL